MIRQDLVIDTEEREAIVELSTRFNVRLNKSKKAFIYIAVGCVVLGIVSYIFTSTLLAIIFILQAVAFVYMSRTGLEKRMKKNLNKVFPEDGTLVRTYTVAQSGLSLNSRYGYDKYNWGNIKKAGKYYHYYYFYRSDGQVMILDHRRLSDEEKQEVLSLIEQNVKGD